MTIQKEPIPNYKSHTYEHKRWCRIVAASRVERKNNSRRELMIYDRRVTESFDFFLTCMGLAPTKNHVVRLRNRSVGYVPGNMFWHDKTSESHPPSFIDLTGKQFGQWIVLGNYQPAFAGGTWTCKCACGREKNVKAASLTTGGSKSCKKCAAQSRSRRGQ